MKNMEAEIKQCHKRGLWTEEEDRALLEYIKVYGIGQWNRIPKFTGLKRCGKSCRLRWLNYLSPNVKRGCFSEEEEDLIIRLHKLLGNRWALIAGRVPGRTDNQVKNHWNTHLSKKLGINISSTNKKQSRRVLFHNHDVVLSKQKLVTANSTTPDISDQLITNTHNIIAITPIMEERGQNCNNVSNMGDLENIVVADYKEGKPEDEALECMRNEIIIGPESSQTSMIIRDDDRDFSEIITEIIMSNDLDGFCIGPELDDHQMYWHYF